MLWPAQSPSSQAGISGVVAGVLTETTAELAVALTMAAARRVVEADTFMRSGKYEGWLPTLFVGALLQNKTVGIIGAGRCASGSAKIVVHSMHLAWHGQSCWKVQEPL